MKSIKILVVEDDLFAFELIKKSLSEDYIVVGNAVSAEEAVVLFKETNPDIVIMDINLEGQIDGIETSEWLNGIKTVPIIYTTGADDMSKLKKRIIDSRPYAFLVKPVNFYELKMVIELSYKNFLAEEKLIELNRQLKRLTKEAGKYEFMIQTALEGGNVLIWEMDFGSNQYLISGNWLKQLAVNRDNALTQIIDYRDWIKNIYDPDYIKVEKEMSNLKRHVNSSFELEYRILTAYSHYIWILSRGKVLEWEEGKSVKIIGTHVNITDRKKTEKQLEAFASKDSLTNTLNRKKGMEYLNHQVLKAKKGGIPFSAAYADIDGLKNVNDTFGHSMGDELILQMIEVFRYCLRETDIISRLGGDEFLLIFTNCRFENAEKIMNRIIDELNIENLDGLYPFFMSLSYGLEEYDPLKKLSPDEYLSHLDSLMYKEKKGKA
jgi:diguanylate cyclase (GGDEF)-like protein